MSWTGKFLPLPLHIVVCDVGNLCNKNFVTAISHRQCQSESHAYPTCRQMFILFNPYPTAFPYGNGMVLHFYQQQESSTTKTVHKVINKGLKTYV